MTELVTTFSMTTVIVVVMAVAFAIKEIIELVEFFTKRIKSKYDKGQEEVDKEKQILDKLDSVEDKIETVSSRQQEIAAKIEEQQDILDLLVESDKDQLKNTIVKEYHHFIQKKWIDDFSMDSLEKCFQHYTAEGGNSYVHDLIDDLRELPHSPNELNQ